MTSPPEGFVPISGAQDLPASAIARNEESLSLPEYIAQGMDRLNELKAEGINSGNRQEATELAQEIDLAATQALNAIRGGEDFGPMPISAVWALTSTRARELRKEGKGPEAEKLVSDFFASREQQAKERDEAARGEGSIADLAIPAADAMTFNFTDEIIGLIAGLGDRSEKEVKGIVDRIRKRRELVQRDLPVASLAAGVAPALIGGLNVAPALKTTGSRVAAGLGVGALSGLGAGEGSVAERAPMAAAGGAIGGVVGAAFPPLAERGARLVAPLFQRGGGELGEAAASRAAADFGELAAETAAAPAARFTPAQDAARRALEEMIEAGEPITAAAVARRAGVSTGPAGKVVRAHRAAQEAATPPAPTSAVVPPPQAPTPSPGAALPSVPESAVIPPPPGGVVGAGGQTAEQVANRIIRLQEAGDLASARVVARETAGQGLTGRQLPKESPEFMKDVIDRVQRYIGEFDAEAAAAQEAGRAARTVPTAQAAAQRVRPASPTAQAPPTTPAPVTTRAAGEAASEVADESTPALNQAVNRAAAAAPTENPTRQVATAVQGMNRGERAAYQSQLVEEIEGAIVSGAIKPKSAGARKALELLKAAFARDRAAGRPVIRRFQEFLGGAKGKASIARRAAAMAIDLAPLSGRLSNPITSALRRPPPGFPLGPIPRPDVLPLEAVGAPVVAGSMVAPGLLPGRNRR